MSLNIDYSGLPEHMQGGYKRYIEEGIPGGSHMTAVLEGDLFKAFATADHINQARMFDTVRWIYNNAPVACYGSPALVKSWLARFESKVS